MANDHLEDRVAETESSPLKKKLLFLWDVSLLTVCVSGITLLLSSGYTKELTNLKRAYNPQTKEIQTIVDHETHFSLGKNLILGGVLNLSRGVERAVYTQTGKMIVGKLENDGSITAINGSIYPPLKEETSNSTFYSF